MADWNIKPRATRCTTCNTPFLAGMSGHSLLELSEEGYTRRDLCENCFRALPKEVGTFASGAWSFTVPKALQKAKEEPVQKETAEHLLRVLSERGNPDDAPVIYVLAILLERSKQCIERKVMTTDEGKRVRLYEHRRSGDVFTIVDPGLTAEDLPGVQQRVLELLEGPLQPPPQKHFTVVRTMHHRRRPSYIVLRKRPS